MYTVYKFSAPRGALKFIGTSSDLSLWISLDPSISDPMEHFLKLIPYLLVYKSTFYDQKPTQKISPDLYTSHTQRPDKAIQEISITIAWSALGKPSLQNQF